MEISINWWAILVCMIASVALGFLWYGPLFGKKWMALVGLAMPAEKPPFKAMLKPICLSLLGTLFMSVTLSLGVSTLSVPAGLIAGIAAWIGFIVPIHFNVTGWEGKPWSLFFINTGYWLVLLLVLGAILAGWR